MCKPGLSPVKASFEHVNFNQFACFIWGHMGLNPSPLTELCTCAHCPILFYLILIIQFKGVCCLLLFFLFFFFCIHTGCFNNEPDFWSVHYIDILQILWSHFEYFLWSAQNTTVFSKTPPSHFKIMFSHIKGDIHMSCLKISIPWIGGHQAPGKSKTVVRQRNVGETEKVDTHTQKQKSVFGLGAWKGFLTVPSPLFSSRVLYYSAILVQIFRRRKWV